MDAPTSFCPAASEAAMDAALTARARRLGIGLTDTMPRPALSAAVVEVCSGAACEPELAAQFSPPARGCPVAREVGISDTAANGPHPGNYWLDVELVDGRRFAAILSPELLAKLVRQSVIVGVAP